jgi:hypothetical protein
VTPATRAADISPVVLADAAEPLIEHAARTDWHGPDPYDGLWWTWPAALTGGRRRRQAIVQLHARAPVDIRRLYRRSHPRIAKTLALFASAGLRTHRITGHPRARALATSALDAVVADRTVGSAAWGYPFDVQTRWSFYPAPTPNVVVTSYVGRALLEGARELGRADWSERAVAAARWVLDDLWVEPEGFFGYHPHSRANVHNASLLGAALVDAGLPDDPTARERVARAVQRALAAQADDGSWPYGDDPSLRWIDSFHTGYVLTCLARVGTAQPGVEDALASGAAFYSRFFDSEGRAALWPGRRFPEDAHSAGTGLTTLSALLAAGHVERPLLERVAHRVLEATIRRGRAVARRYRWGSTTVWYPRWCDGHVACGLGDAAVALTGHR